MTDERTDSWRVCLRGPDGTAVGAGVLIAADGLILTCAHVVIAALGLAPGATPSDASVRVDFPGSAEGGPATARVLADGWYPIDGAERGDLALLSMPDGVPGDVRPAALAAAGDLPSAEVRAFGHPGGSWGVWARARQVGTGGPRRQWVQLDAVDGVGRRLAGGFSGAGVTALGRVIGLVVAEESAADARVGWMIPIEVCADYHSPLRALIGNAPAVPAPADPTDPPADPTDPPADPPTGSSTAEVMRLAALVAALPTMNSPERRCLVVDALPADIAAATPRATDRFADALGLVRTCLQYDGGLPALIAVLRGFEGRSLPMRALLGAVARRDADVVA